MWIKPDWSSLSHAYGSASDIPGLLEELSRDPPEDVWSELWGRVCHQGSIYSASPYVLQPLLEVARTRKPQARVMPICLAGSIFGSRDFPSEGFRDCIEELGRLAKETLDSPEITKIERVHLMGAAVSFSEDRVWGSAIDRINDEEFCGICSLCEAELYFAIQQEGGFIRGDWEEDPETRQGEIRPADEANLPNPGAWLHEVAVRAGDADLALRIRLVFGTAICTSCDESIDVATAIEKFEKSND